MNELVPAFTSRRMDFEKLSNELAYVSRSESRRVHLGQATIKCSMPFSDNALDGCTAC